MNLFKTEPAFPYILWFIGAISIFGLGFLTWSFWRRDKLILDKTPAVSQREKEFDLLKQELQKEKQLLEEEVNAHRVAEEKLLQKEDEITKLKEMAPKSAAVAVEDRKEGERWIAGKTPEKRRHPRLDLSDLTVELTKDYNRTIMLRIETQDQSQNIRVFAGNISMGGLSFESNSKFNIGDRLNLRLFFFGDSVPHMKIKAEVAWEKAAPPVYRYGVSFISLEEKDKEELSRYIESKANTDAEYSPPL